MISHLTLPPGVRAWESREQKLFPSDRNRPFLYYNTGVLYHDYWNMNYHSEYRRLLTMYTSYLLFPS